MKKLFLTLVCAVVALTASAQRASSSSSSFFSTESSDQPITFSIRAGVNFANVSITQDNVTLSPESKTGFNAGVAVDFPILQSLYIQTGLYYTTKGCKVDTYKINAGFIEIPILASYRYTFSEAAQLQINFGPYFAYGVNGKLERESRGVTTKIDLFGSDNDGSYGLKRFDMGLQAGGGVTIAQHYFVGLAYEFGLVALNRGTGSIKTNNFMINLGYQF